MRNRTEEINVRVFKTEKNLIRRKARKCGMNLFQDYLADYDSCDFERSYAKLAVTFYDEFGNELTFRLSKKETQYVVKTITKKLDSMTVDDGGGGFGDEG